MGPDGVIEPDSGYWALRLRDIGKSCNLIVVVFPKDAFPRHAPYANVHFKQSHMYIFKQSRYFVELNCSISDKNALNWHNSIPIERLGKG